LIVLLLAVGQLGLTGPNAIADATAKGLMWGYADGTFRPSNPLSRAEAVVILNRALGRGPLYGLESSPWADVPDTHWARRDIEEASVDHEYVPRTEGGSGEQLSSRPEQHRP